MTDREIDVIVSASPHEISLDVHIDNVNPCEYPVLETLDCSYILNPSYGLSTKLLTCVLPSYDFSDVPTQLALTVPQKVDLATYLCDPVVIIQTSAIYSNPLYNAALLLNAEYPDVVLQAITGADYSVAGTLAALKLAVTYEANVRVDAIATATNAVIDTNTTAAHKTYIVQNMAVATLFGNETTAQQDYNSTNIDYSVGARLTALVANTKWATDVLPYAISNGTCQQLNDNLSMTQKGWVYKIPNLRTGQTRSYAAGDDGALQNGRGAAWGTLNCNNDVPNTNRFVTPVANYTQDWQTDLAWYTVLQAGTAWANIPALLAALNLTLPAGFGDYYWGNTNEHFSAVSFENGNFGALKTSLNVTVAAPYYIWTSTTNEANNTYAWALYARNITQPTLNAVPKTTAYQWICTRKF